MTDTTYKGTFVPTCLLKCVETQGKTLMMQMWVTELGETEWRLIEGHAEPAPGLSYAECITGSIDDDDEG